MDSITSFHEYLDRVIKKYIKDKSAFIHSLDISRSMFYRWLNGEQLPKEELFEELIALLSDQYSVTTLEIEQLKTNYILSSLDELTQHKIKAANIFLNIVSKAISMSNDQIASYFYSSSNMVEAIIEEPFDETKCIVGVSDVKDILLYILKASIIDKDCHEMNILARPDKLLMETIQIGLRSYREDFIVNHFFNTYEDSFLCKDIYQLIFSVMNTGIVCPNYSPNIHDSNHRSDDIFNAMPYVIHTNKRLLLFSSNYDYAFYYYPKDNDLPLSIYKNYFKDLLKDESVTSLFLRSSIKNGAPILHKIEANSLSMNIIKKAFTQFSIPMEVFDFRGIDIQDEGSIKDFFGEEIETFMMNQIKALNLFYSMIENNKKVARITLTKKGVYDFMKSGKIDKQDNIPVFALTQRVMIIRNLIKLIETHDNFQARLLRDERLTLFPFMNNLALINFDDHIIISPLCNNNLNSLNNTLRLKTKFLIDAIPLYYEHIVIPKMSSKKETLSFLKEVIASHV